MKKWIIALILLFTLSLTACWDMVEINQRLFVSSIGIDLNNTRDINKYSVTYVYPNINAVGKNASEDKKVFVINAPSSSLFQAGRSASTQEEFPFYYKHLKVLIIGEDLSRDKKLVKQLIDELNRDTKINKKIQILIAKGDAKDILSSKSTNKHSGNETIYNILKDNKSAARFTPQTLTGIIKEMDYNNVCTVPLIEKIEDKVDVGGAVIMKDYKSIGELNGIQNRAIALVRNEVKQELIDIEYKKNLLSYNITVAKSTKDVIIDENINVNINVNTEGYLQGYTMGRDVNVYNNKILTDMEKAIEKQLKKEIEDTIALSQKKYNADIIGIREYLSKYHPNEWENIKEKWDEIYPDIKFNIIVDVKIRRTGLTK
jgi:Ger(x)C family germination protein